jgi:hypothetical protein
MTDALAAAIDAMPIPTAINGVVPLTYLHTERGKVRSKKALGNDFADWAKGLAYPTSAAFMVSRRAVCGAGLRRT